MNNGGVVVIVGLLGIALANPPTVTRVQSTEAEVGQADLPGVQITFEVDGTPDQVVDALWSGTNFGAVFPTVTRTEVLSDGAQQKQVSMTEEFMMLSFTSVIRLERTKDGIVYKEDEAGAKPLRGTLHTEAVGEGRSRVTFKGYADMGWMIPDKVLQSEMEKMAPEIVARTQALME